MSKKAITYFVAIIALSVCLGNFFPCSAQFMSGEQANHEQDEARCRADETVFDQTDVLQSDAYKTASEQERYRMLQETFYDKVGTELIWKGIYGIRDQALGVASLVGILYALGKHPSLQNAAGGIAGAGGYFSVIHPLVQQMKTIGSGVWKRYVSRYENTHIGQLEGQYIIHRPSFSSKLQATLDSALVKAYCTYSKEHREKELEKVRIALALPTTTKPLIFDPDKFNKAFSQEYEYPDTTVQELELFAVNIAKSSHKLPENIKPSPKIAYYFYGKPSTGKTTALSLIADMYDIPVEVIHLQDSAAYLQGDTEKPGEIVQRLISHKPGQKAVKNKIIFFDDADTVLTHPNAIYDLLLRWTEGQTNTMESPFFAADIDISKLIFVFAGNAPIEEFHDPKGALKSRLFVVEFPEYPFDYKIKTVWEKTIPDLLAESSQTATVPITLEDFTQEDRNKIDEMVKTSDFRMIKTRLKNIVLRKEHDKAYSKRK